MSNKKTKSKPATSSNPKARAELSALRELSKSAQKVCNPLFTNSDGGDMWCALRNRPGAKASVERLEAAIKSANRLIAANRRLEARLRAVASKDGLEHITETKRK